MLCALGASAQADGLDAERAQPATGVEGGFILEHAGVPGHLDWGIGLFVDYANDSVVVVDANDDVVARPLADAATADLLGAIGIFGRVELGLHLPIQFVYSGDSDVIAGGSTLSASAGLGDLRIVPKVGILRSGDAASHTLLSFALPFTLPTGNPEAFRGADGFSIEPELLAAFHFGSIGILVNAGYKWRSDHPVGLPWGDEITFGAGLLYELTEDFRVRGEVFGAKQVRTDVDGADFTLELLGGVEYWLGNVGLYGGAGLGLTDGIGEPDFRIIGGVRFRVGHDPDEGFRDRDNDGVSDHDDAAPDDPEDEDGYQDDDGAPEPDNDGDGIRDEDDECPDIPEEPGGDKDGCPEKTFVKVENDKIYVFGKVRFRTGSAEIDKRDEPLLDQLGSALQTNPQVKKVRIEGHTDNVGDPKSNQSLSDARARSVKSALEKRGVDGGRMQPAGYGESRPVAPNKTAAGRAKNRRVEFVISERK